MVPVAVMALLVAACSDERPPLGGPGVGGGGDIGGAGEGGDGGMGGEAVGVGGTSMSAGGAGGMPPDFTPCASPPSDYPSAPYGEELGDTIALLDLAGWINADGMGLANAEPFMTFGTADIRDSGPTHVMLHLAATW
jgi:hypothetical protein